MGHRFREVSRINLKDLLSQNVYGRCSTQDRAWRRTFSSIWNEIVSTVAILDERTRRIGLNEALFREVNERLNDVNNTFSVVTGVMEILCECGDLSCVEQLSLAPGDYERLRSDPTWFAVVPGHDIEMVEIVIASYPAYDIVQKRAGAPAEVAKATDVRR